MNRTDFDFKPNNSFAAASVRNGNELELRSSFTEQQRSRDQNGQQKALTQELIVRNDQIISEENLNKQGESTFRNVQKHQKPRTVHQWFNYGAQNLQNNSDTKEMIDGLSPGQDRNDSRQSEMEDHKNQLGLDQAMVELMRLSDIEAQSSGNFAQAGSSIKRIPTQTESFQKMVTRFQLDRLEVVTDARDLLVIANAEIEAASPTNSWVFPNSGEDSHSHEDGSMMEQKRRMTYQVKNRAKMLIQHVDSVVDQVHELIPENETHEEMSASKAPSSDNKVEAAEFSIDMSKKRNSSVEGETQKLSASNSVHKKPLSPLRMQVQRSLQRSDPSRNTEHLAEIIRILDSDSKLRSDAQSQLLTNYLQQFDYFKHTIENDADAYMQLSRAVKVMKCKDGYDIIQEGDDGDTFYFVLEGRINVLKAQMVPIETSEVLNAPAVDQRNQAWINTYFYALRNNYMMIFWKGMMPHFSQRKVAYILGINEDEMYSVDPVYFAKPIAQQSKREDILWELILQHQAQGSKYFNSEGIPCLLINKSLVHLNQGAGFGELALMSNVKRMTTCRASAQTTLGILNRKNFTIILHRAQKKKINAQIGKLREYKLFTELSWLKLQKIFYLLEEKHCIKGSVLFSQDEKVHGCYFIESGQILYKRKLEVPALEQRPAVKTSAAEGVWVNNQSLVQLEKLKRRTATRPVAEFSSGEIIGWEELVCERVISELRKSMDLARQTRDRKLLRELESLNLSNKNQTHYFSYTGVVTSMHAKLYYLSRENFEAFLKYISIDVCKSEVHNRITLTQSQINIIETVESQQADLTVHRPRPIQTAIAIEEENQQYQAEQERQITEEREKQFASFINRSKQTKSTVVTLPAESLTQKSVASLLNNHLFTSKAMSKLNDQSSVASLAPKMRRSLADNQRVKALNKVQSGTTWQSQSSFIQQQNYLLVNDQTVKKKNQIDEQPYDEYASAEKTAEASRSAVKKIQDKTLVSFRNNFSQVTDAEEDSGRGNISIRNRNIVSSTIKAEGNASRDRLFLQYNSLMTVNTDPQTKEIPQDQETSSINLYENSRNAQLYQTRQSQVVLKTYALSSSNSSQQQLEKPKSASQRQNVKLRNATQSNNALLSSQAMQRHAAVRIRRTNKASQMASQSVPYGMLAGKCSTKSSENLRDPVKRVAKPPMYRTAEHFINLSSTPYSDTKEPINFNKMASGYINRNSMRTSTFGASSIGGSSAEEDIIMIDDEAKSRLGRPNTSTLQGRSGYISRADMVRRLAQQRQNDLTKSCAQIWSRQEEMKTKSEHKSIAPASLDLQDIKGSTDEKVNSVEDLVQKNFLKFSRQTGQINTQQDKQNSSNSSFLLSNSNNTAHSRSLLNFTKLKPQDQRKVRALRRAEFNAYECKKETLKTDLDLKRGLLGPQQQSKRLITSEVMRTEPNVFDNPQKIVEQQARKQESRMNERLLDVLQNMTTEGLGFSEKSNNKRIKMLTNKSDSMIASMGDKKPSLYNQIKKLAYITTSVGPAYSKIVKQRHRHETLQAKIKLKKDQEEEQQQQYPRHRALPNTVQKQVKIQSISLNRAKKQQEIRKFDIGPTIFMINSYHSQRGLSNTRMQTGNSMQSRSNSYCANRHLVLNYVDNDNQTAGSIPQQKLSAAIYSESGETNINPLLAAQRDMEHLNLFKFDGQVSDGKETLDSVVADVYGRDGRGSVNEQNQPVWPRSLQQSRRAESSGEAQEQRILVENNSTDLQVTSPNLVPLRPISQKRVVKKVLDPLKLSALNDGKNLLSLIGEHIDKSIKQAKDTNEISSQLIPEPRKPTKVTDIVVSTVDDRKQSHHHYPLDIGNSKAYIEEQLRAPSRQSADSSRRGAASPTSRVIYSKQSIGNLSAEH